MLGGNEKKKGEEMEEREGLTSGTGWGEKSK